MAAPPPSTAVPFPTLGPNGFVIPAESLILAGVQSDINGAFGGNLNQSLTTPQGQLATSETAIIGDSFAVFAWFCNMIDPAYSVGRMQDAIGRIYFIKRIPGAPTIQSCTCLGLSGAMIPVGALAQDANGNLWIAQVAGTIVNGQVTLPFASTTNGPNPGPASLSIYQAVSGWESVAPVGNAVLGNDVETPAQFETRRSLSTGLNSMGPLNAVLAAVLNVSGVLDCYAFQNNTNVPVSVGGVTLLPNSIYICPLGGSANDIAQAIYSRKMPGCAMTGNTTVNVPDPNPAYLPPVPVTPITWQSAAVTPFAVVVTIGQSSGIPATALSSVQNAIVNAFAGLDGGPRAKIGSAVLASRYYSPVTAISNTYNGSTGQVIPGWSAAIVQIQIGVDGNAASIQGSIAGNTLTVASVSSGSVQVGNLVEGTFTGGSGFTSPVLIVSQISGTPGGVGAYQINQFQTVPSGPMQLTTLVNEVQMNINQAPAVSALNVYLAIVPI